ncbi:riboflavin transporter [Flavonifractor sp. An52]|uniref:ECF transporter S component n=1 Tax=Flavonifractor sp. An52 TaxID=1965642 RepID=UPI000B38270F|nr:ECF transporter S component [Flavonifractor sp. An52]OUN85791.1 riboflavin transporter [Flavonifractor sp. An52]
MVNQKTRRMVMAALLAALTTAATMVIRIPTPTLGYIHLGDSMVLLCGILLGPGLGAAAAGIGSMLADLFGGFTAWAPGTFAIKALTALVGGSLYRLCLSREHIAPPLRVILCGIPAEAVMVAGYFLYEVGMMALAGSNLTAAATAVLAGVPFNVVQGLSGIVVGVVLLPVLSQAGAGAEMPPHRRKSHNF